MPKSDTWPGGVAMESLSNMDSAGSCDSVISMNSNYSEDSMQHLSAEERACLMYLEETIESLEVQEDSGLSNDEPDHGLQTQNLGLTRVNDNSSFKSESDGGEHHHHLNQTSEPQSSTVSPANGQDDKSATQTKMLCVSTDRDGKPKIVASTNTNLGQSTEASDVDLVLIPPPSDFMDEPGPPAQPKKIKDLYRSPVKTKPGATVDLEELRQRASVKRTSMSPSVTQEDPNMAPAEVSPSFSPQSPIISDPHVGLPSESADPRCPPAVAPKPKKLPSNIILKSHKVSASSDGNTGHSVPSSSDRVLLDPQKVRHEALRKLGLLKSEEVVSCPALSPKHSPQTRRSWPTPPSPVSPAAPHTPPLMPSSTYVNIPLPPVPLQSPVPMSSSSNCTAQVTQYSPDIFPAPAAFSDPTEPLLKDKELSAVQDVSEAKVGTQVNTPPLTPPALIKQLTPPKIRDGKSATLERSGLGLSSYMTGQDSTEANQGVRSKLSPSQLHNSRPRPASLGSRKEFVNDQGVGLQAGSATVKESLPGHTAIQHSGDSQKLPRSQGISVLICPRAENGEDRRKALKKLGLLRD